MTLAGKRPSVLVVEDEDNIALALEFILLREGYDYARISDGTAALPRIRAMRPDLVLLDVMLPGASGYEICQNVRQDPDLKGVKILMMTARGSSLERSKGLAIGADGFISKPFELKNLRDEVRRLLKADHLQPDSD